MASRTNFKVRRAERNRAQKARNEEKLRQKQERSDLRKAARDEVEGSNDAADDTNC